MKYSGVDVNVMKFIIFFRLKLGLVDLHSFLEFMYGILSLVSSGLFKINQ